MSDNVFYVTNKELFYAAMMLGLGQLVNVVYDFPANEASLKRELEDVKRSLRRKKLLTESARRGISIDSVLGVCAMFCAEPESCEVIDINDYHATSYSVAGTYMLLEQRGDGEFAALWFLNREKLDEYINNEISNSDKSKSSVNDGSETEIKNEI